jgi:AraC-like DNA-binding protein
MEHIISFLPDNSRVHNQFNIDITGISYPDPHYHVERINSQIYCLEYIMEGEGTVYVDDTVFYPAKGDIYILPKGHHHRYYSSQTNPWKKIWMNVYGPLCDSLMNLYHLDGVYHIPDFNLLELFEEFLKISEQKEEGINQIFSRCSLIYHEILIRISKHLYEKPVGVNVAAYEIKEYIDRNIYDKLNMEKIAKTVCLSPSQVNRIFKREFHQTPYDYVISRKLETAKLLLQNTNIPIKQIADRLNFADEHYFSNVFKAHYGMSPKYYGIPGYRDKQQIQE